MTSPPARNDLRGTQYIFMPSGWLNCTRGDITHVDLIEDILPRCPHHRSDAYYPDLPCSFKQNTAFSDCFLRCGIFSVIIAVFLSLQVHLRGRLWTLQGKGKKKLCRVLYKWQHVLGSCQAAVWAVCTHIPPHAWAGSVFTYASLRYHQYSQNHRRGDRNLPHSSTVRHVTSFLTVSRSTPVFLPKNASARCILYIPAQSQGQTFHMMKDKMRYVRVDSLNFEKILFIKCWSLESTRVFWSCVSNASFYGKESYSSRRLLYMTLLRYLQLH